MWPSVETGDKTKPGETAGSSAHVTVTYLRVFMQI